MIDTSLPKIVYGATTLYLPRKFTKWERKFLSNNVVTRGPVYTQVTSYPTAYEIKCTTDVFVDTQESWDGGASGYFLPKWNTFYTTWARLGKVFSFYRTGTDSTAGWSYYQYCVNLNEDDGLSLLIGNPRYTVEVQFRTESAAR